MAVRSGRGTSGGRWSAAAALAWTVVLGVVLATSLLAGSGGAPTSTSQGPEERLGRSDAPRITVFAAASLTEAFRDLARAFEVAEGGRPVALNLAGSQTLAAQILAGAPADVYASANALQMERVRREGLLVGSPSVFAENGLAVVTEVGNPRGIRELADLARPGLAVVLAAPEVPVGRYARAALEQAGVRVRPVSLETDVKQVLAKVALGEADAGIVYRTDLRAAGSSVGGFALPDEVDRRALYRVGLLDGPARGSDARGFVEFLRSPEARRILRSHGFETGES